MKRAYRNPSYIFFSWLKNYFHVKKWGVIGLLLTAILTSPGAGLARAGDLEVFLGTSSGFKIVRGTSVSSGTTTFYVGSSTVSIGTTTQAAMLTIDGSMTATSISTGTITATTGTLTIRGTGLNNYGTVAAGGLIVGMVSANSAVTGGTTTVHFLDDIYAHGTVTAAGFIGDGSRLTNVPAGSPSANSVDSSQLVNTLNITDTTMNVGSLTVSAGNFRVDSAGSTTVSVLTTTGSATVAGTMTAAGGNFTVNGSTGAVTANNSFTLSTGTLTAGGGAFKVDEVGSTTVKTLTVSPGTLTAGRGAFKVDENGSMTATTITATGSVTASNGLTVKNGASPGYMEIYEPSGSGTNKIKIQSQAISADYTLTLPVDDGTSGQSLTTDGSGALSWTTISGGSSVYGFVQLTSTTGAGFTTETNFGANETESTATSGTTWDAVNSKLTIDAGNGGTYKVLVNLVLIGSDNADTYNLALKVESTTKNSVTGFDSVWNTIPYTSSIAWVGTINASESVSITIVRASGTGNMKYGSGATLYVEKL